MPGGREPQEYCNNGHLMTETRYVSPKGKTHCRICRNTRSSSHSYKENRRDPDYQHNYNMKKKYGITGEDYLRILDEQNGVCAICGEINPGNKRLAVDHDHETNEVRGLLCDCCNRAIGLLRDDEHIAQRATNYLRLWKDREG